MSFIVRDAVRESVAVLTAVYGPTGGGKTFSGLLLAAGLAGPNGKVGMLDTENKRGSLYADDPDIRKAMPGGSYRIVDFAAPYTPARYVEGLKALEADGCTVGLVDSGTHEWSGEGGCCDIAENSKLGGMPNWAKAKLEHKRFMAYCLSSRMHIVFCFRAHDKVKPVKAGDLISPDGAERYEKSAVIPLGMQPDCEKNCIFEMMLSLRIEEKTHFAQPVKVPRMLSSIFPGGKMVTVEDGAAIRRWNETGAARDAADQLRRRARLEAERGAVAYEQFFKSLTKEQRLVLKDYHPANKAIAEAADKAGQPTNVDSLPPAIECSVGTKVRFKGAVHEVVIEGEDHAWREVAA